MDFNREAGDASPPPPAKHKQNQKPAPFQYEFVPALTKPILSMGRNSHAQFLSSVRVRVLKHPTPSAYKQARSDEVPLQSGEQGNPAHLLNIHIYLHDCSCPPTAICSPTGSAGVSFTPRGAAAEKGREGKGGVCSYIRARAAPTPCLACGAPPPTLCRC